MIKTRSRLYIFFSRTGALVYDGRDCSKANHLHRRGQAFKLACLGGVTSVEHLPEICSSHEDTDVRIIIYVKHIQTTMSHIKTIRVRAKDSDIFFIFLYFAKAFTVDILMDTGEKLIIISQLADNYSQEHIAALLALHAFTGANCTSAFKGKGNVRPMKLLSQNSSLYIYLLQWV